MLNNVPLARIVRRLLIGALVATAAIAALPQEATVSVVHFRADESPAGNLTTLVSLVREAASRGASVIVLPDDPVLPQKGRGPDEDGLWAMVSAQAERRFSSLAKELRVWIAMTLPRTSPDGKITRSCIVFSDRGAAVLQDGRPDPVNVAVHDYTRFGVTTSQSLASDAERLVQLGSRFIVVPASGAPVLEVAKQLAATHGVAVLIASRDAESPSAIVDGNGAVVAEASGGENLVLTSALPDVYAGLVPLGLPADATPVYAQKSAAAVRLGRKLFFDRSLAANEHNGSCADCHDPEQAYGNNESNTPSLLNSAWYERYGRRATIATLEAAVMHRTDKKEALADLGKSSEYGPAFEAAFGSSNITHDTLAAALASFVRTLDSANSAFDRAAYGAVPEALTSAARRGLFLFARKAHCGGCHRYTRDFGLFTDNRAHESGIGPEPSAPYRTPMLRDVALTPPYMHDGSLKSLSEVVEFYDRGGHPGGPGRLHLSASEREDLVAFLESLTGEPASGGLETRTQNTQSFAVNEWRR